MDAVILSLLASFFWGTTVVAEKVIVDLDVDIRTLACLKHLIGSVCFMVWLMASSGERQLIIPRSAWTPLMYTAIVGSFLGFWFYFSALELEDSSKVAFISSTYPLFAVLTALVWLNEDVNYAFLAGGGGLILTGVYIISQA